MDRLAGQRVAIIGTGATAVQCVPELARACGELYVFQRTPSSVDVRGNEPLDPGWFAGISAAGWQQRWLDNFTANWEGVAGLPADGDLEDLVHDAVLLELPIAPLCREGCRGLCPMCGINRNEKTCTNATVAMAPRNAGPIPHGVRAHATTARNAAVPNSPARTPRCTPMPS